MIDEKCVDTLLTKYFERENILVNHQIESFNDFIDTILPTIISQSFPLTIKFHDKTLNIHELTMYVTSMDTENPYYTENNGCTKTMTPHIARLRTSKLKALFSERYLLLFGQNIVFGNLIFYPSASLMLGDTQSSTEMKK